MRPVNQTNFGVPGGNCFQASVASIFNKPLEEVPDFCNAYDEDHWWDEFENYCMRFGLFPIALDPHAPLAYDKMGFYLALGKTAIGHYHAVVYAKGELAHDPIPGGPGLEEVETYVVFASMMFNGVK